MWGTFPARSAAGVAVQARPNIVEVQRTVVVAVVAMRITFHRRNGPRFGAQQRARRTRGLPLEIFALSHCY
jgi:hypothetical protein